MRHLLSVRIRIGEAPTDWPGLLLSRGWIAVLISPIFLLAGLLVIPDGLDVLAGRHGWRSVVSYVGCATLGLLPLIAWIMLLKKRALGLPLLLGTLVYVGPMLSAFLVATVVLGSAFATASTILLAFWSLSGLKTVDARVSKEAIHKIAARRIAWENGAPVLLHVTASSGESDDVNTALAGLRKPWSVVAEFAGALVILFFGTVLLPLVIASDAVQGLPQAWVLWFVLAAIFLACRGMMNTWTLLLRAMSIAVKMKSGIVVA